MAVNLSTANQSYIEKASAAKQTTTNPMVSSENTSETKKIDKKKLACSIGAALGAVALAATVIHFVKKGNAKGAKEAVDAAGKAGKQAAEAVSENISEKASEVSTQFEKGIKKFFNGETLVDGVKLEKGKALNADGSPFSGVMKTMSKDGSTVAIEYADGFMTSSTKNGKLIKTFDEFGNGLSRKQGVHITKYLEDGKTEDIYETFHDSGKLKKFIKSQGVFENGNKLPYVAKQYNENGKLTAKFEGGTGTGCTKLQKADFFDSEGKSESIICSTLGNDSNYSKISYSKDGACVKQSIHGRMKETDFLNKDISSSEYIPKDVVIYTPDRTPVIACGVSDGIGYSDVYVSKKGIDDIMSVRLADGKHNITYLDGPNKQICTLLNDTLTVDKGASKDDITLALEYLKDSVTVLKQNGMFGSEAGKAARYENLIKQLEEYAKKL